MKKIIFSLGIAFAMFFSAQVMSAQQTTQELPTLTSKAYASMKKDDVYVVIFSAVYCGPCRLAKQELFPELIKKYVLDKNVHFYVLDIEKDEAAPDGTFLKDRWGVEFLPTFVVAYNDAVMYLKTGYSSDQVSDLKKELVNKINSLK